ncbi:hypothetical protein DER29_0506 [Micromonospora sp. M71_S20]|uniref:hypothetical protein n=1 Tax=Micromonospora sp. M71_S20 TaxID=592872 RepID=UPI000EB38BCE|nr:hypothetical protein [Micromonospora sp. M71_S20]RLK22667.1 hypothetical protein DER29_0506 [Micromonospora sp. M71_S20]
MRDHPFEGPGAFCQHWTPLASRNTADGLLSFRSQCGYGRDTHPDAEHPMNRETRAEEDELNDLCGTCGEQAGSLRHTDPEPN